MTRCERPPTVTGRGADIRSMTIVISALTSREDSACGIQSGSPVMCELRGTPFTRSSDKPNSRKFAVASGPPDAAASTPERYGVVPSVSKRGDQVAFVSALCIKVLRLVTQQLPEKSWSNTYERTELKSCSSEVLSRLLIMLCGHTLQHSTIPRSIGPARFRSSDNPTQPVAVHGGVPPPPGGCHVHEIPTGEHDPRVP